MTKRLFPILLATSLLLTMVPAVLATSRTDGTITIHMYDNTGAGAGNVPADGQIITNPGSLGQPVAGIEFRVSQVKVAAHQTISTFTVSDAQAFVAANGTKYPGTLYQESIITDGNGEAAFPSSSSGLTGLLFGIYLVEEIAGGGSIAATMPFLVYLPMTLAGENDAPDRLLYDVHVYPKRQPLYIIKDGDTHAANVGETVSWTIETSIPANIATLDLNNGGYYIVRDDLDPRLNYISTAVTTSGGTVLAAGTDYILFAPNPSDSGYDGGGRVEVRITAAGVNKLITALAAGDSLHVTIVTVINDKALLGTGPSPSQNPTPEPVTNSATLFYKNQNGNPDDPDPGEGTEEPPEVDVTGLTVIKVDGENGALLPGAQFELYWCDSGDDPNDPGNYSKVATGTTNQSGYIYWKFDEDFNEGSNTNTGAGYGYYYVREIKAPDGYQLLDGISEIALLVSGGAEGYIWRLSNHKLGGDFELPSSGGSGTMLYTVLGVCLIVVGVGSFVLMVCRRRQ